MRWKKRHANIIVICILTLAITIVTLLNIIGPLHMNDLGTMNSLGMLSVYSIVYYVISLVVLWGMYFQFRNRPELLFFLLVAIGILIMIIEVFIWGWAGS